jgi:hypothetical protein
MVVKIGVEAGTRIGNSSKYNAVASLRLYRASSIDSPCVVVPVSGLYAIYPPSSAIVRTADNCMLVPLSINEPPDF